VQFSERVQNIPQKKGWTHFKNTTCPNSDLTFQPAVEKSDPSRCASLKKIPSIFIFSLIKTDTIYSLSLKTGHIKLNPSSNNFPLFSRSYSLFGKDPLPL